MPKETNEVPVLTSRPKQKPLSAEETLHLESLKPCPTMCTFTKNLLGFIRGSVDIGTVTFFMDAASVSLDEKEEEICIEVPSPRSTICISREDVYIYPEFLHNAPISFKFCDFPLDPVSITGYPDPLLISQKLIDVIEQGKRAEKIEV